MLRATRPTAINLFWGLERVIEKAKAGNTVESIRKVILDEALKIAKEDIQNNKQLGINGAKLVEDGDIIMTHCNAGSLATVAYRTALGVIREQ